MSNHTRLVFLRDRQQQQTKNTIVPHFDDLRSLSAVAFFVCSPIVNTKSLFLNIVYINQISNMWKFRACSDLVIVWGVIKITLPISDSIQHTSFLLLQLGIVSIDWWFTCFGCKLFCLNRFFVIHSLFIVFRRYSSNTSVRPKSVF